MRCIGRLGLICACLFACAGVQAAEVLRVLAWPGYADHDLLVAFERKHGVEVEVLEVGSDDALWEQATAEARGYDVIALNTAELQRYVDAGLVQPLRMRNIPNAQQQAPRFQNANDIPGLVRAGRQYGVAYTYSEMGLIYNRRLVNEAPTSINALWDPRYRGKVLAYNGSSHNFTLAAQSLGLPDPFRLDAAQFARAIHQLRALRDNVLHFYSRPEEVVESLRNEEVAIVFANYGRQQLRQLERAGGLDVGYVIPREGAFAWLDCWAVLRSAQDPALAEAFINHMLSPAVSNQLPLRQGLSSTLSEPHDASRIIWLRPVEDYGKRALFWERILAGHRHAQ
ncbi:extracellular solute-binding protein [Niveibacterium sp. SC-1]|uniref:extracellular solute-binding protein n=1 Tax=Niveibacterium sp. SC-1 TaxID=3135646 RepID=UPI00311E695F